MVDRESALDDLGTLGAGEIRDLIYQRKFSGCKNRLNSSHTQKSSECHSILLLFEHPPRITSLVRVTAPATTSSMICGTRGLMSLTRCCVEPLAARVPAENLAPMGFSRIARTGYAQDPTDRPSETWDSSTQPEETSASRRKQPCTGATDLLPALAVPAEEQVCA